MERQELNEHLWWRVLHHPASTLYFIMSYSFIAAWLHFGKPKPFGIPHRQHRNAQRVNKMSLLWMMFGGCIFFFVARWVTDRALHFNWASILKPERKHGQTVYFRFKFRECHKQRRRSEVVIPNTISPDINIYSWSTQEEALWFMCAGLCVCVCVYYVEHTTGDSQAFLARVMSATLRTLSTCSFQLANWHQ